MSDTCCLCHERPPDCPLGPGGKLVWCQSCWRSQSLTVLYAAYNNRDAPKPSFSSDEQRARRERLDREAALIDRG